MILVTGAGGKTGRAVVSAAARRGCEVRALVRRPGQAGALVQLGAREPIVGDLARTEDLQRACRGVDAVYHICPNLHPDEVLLAQLLLREARSAGVRTFVYHSVLHPQTREMPHHRQKLHVEELLFESSLEYTILQPAAYMQNLLAGRDEILERGVYRVPYALETRLGMVDLGDVAEAAARVLTEPGHAFATYELAGPEVLDQREVARQISEAIGRPVRAERIGRRQWAKRARDSGLGCYPVATLLRMFEYYERHGFYGNPRVLALLLGRPPTSFARFAQTLAGA